MKRMSKAEETVVSEDQLVLSCVMSFGWIVLIMPGLVQ